MMVDLSGKFNELSLPLYEDVRPAPFEFILNYFLQVMQEISVIYAIMVFVFTKLKSILPLEHRIIYFIIIFYTVLTLKTTLRP